MRSTEGQLVRAVQDSTQQLLARMDSHALDAYKVAVNAHNQAQLARVFCTNYQNDNLPLLPRKNSAGELPPAGGCCLASWCCGHFTCGLSTVAHPDRVRGMQLTELRDWTAHAN